MFTSGLAIARAVQADKRDHLDLPFALTFAAARGEVRLRLPPARGDQSRHPIHLLSSPILRFDSDLWHSDRTMPEMEISLDQFIQDLRSARNFRATWSYAWVLGSGAAFTSGIPTGRTLALRWIRELFETRHRGASPDDFAVWDAATELKLPGLDIAEPASFYGSLYKLRFGHQPRLGQEFLPRGRTPGCRGGFPAASRLVSS